jgi:hypothetical protein
MKKVREAAPVQVYLDSTERARLERLADQLALTRSDVVRRGLEALEREVTDPEEHPVLRIIGIGSSEEGDGEVDVARNHDRVLAELEIASWSRKPGRRRGR